MCSTVLIWLRLCAGVSRSTFRKVAGALRLITAAAILLVAMVAGAVGVLHTVPNFVPLDERTILQQLCLEPTILRTVCCPKCYTAYRLDALPSNCSRKASPFAQACGEPLTRLRHTRNGPMHVPRALYSTQSFESWLSFFLSRAEIEKQLDKQYEPRAADGAMHGIWDSPAWQSLPGAYTARKYNLVFSFYMDWFNPFGNKHGGKIVSCGAVMLACMNLPAELRHLPENMFFACLMPPPSPADFITLSHLTAPVIAQLLRFWIGLPMQTFLHPEGIFVRAALLAIIADLGAIRKLCGYVGHSADLFCSYCLCRMADIEGLALGDLRTADTVRQAALEWRAQVTITDREAVTAETGIRWSPLHSLPYWDPVHSLVPGFMHNWCEGVLTRQLRVLWGIGIPDNVVAAETAAAAIEKDAEEVYDESDYDAELEALAEESQTSGSTGPAESQRSRSQSIYSTASEGNNLSDDALLDDNSTIHADSDPDYEDLDPMGPATLSDAELAAIRHCCTNIILPTWVERPPPNLGEKTHGKLKADTVLTLFTVVLPMVLPEIWTLPNSNPRQKGLLQNFAHLVSASNIIASFSTSDARADEYMQHYIAYRRTRAQLWPDSHSVPNDHIAMHNGAALKFWGPLAPLSEFVYERQNGVLADISTNNRLCAYSSHIAYTHSHPYCR